jgi:hypothetical protein
MWLAHAEYGIASMVKEMGIEILLVQKLILKKIRERKDILVNGSREGIEKVLRTMIILNPLEKFIFIKL